MHSDAFDVIPYEVCRRLMTPAESIAHYFIHFIHQDIKGDWVRLGSGSFGNVYKGVPRICQRINSL